MRRCSWELTCRVAKVMQAQGIPCRQCGRNCGGAGAGLAATFLPCGRVSPTHWERRSGRISVKATTEEHMGFTGSGEGIAAHAVCLLEELSP